MATRSPHKRPLTKTEKEMGKTFTPAGGAMTTTQAMSSLFKQAAALASKHASAGGAPARLTGMLAARFGKLADKTGLSEPLRSSMKRTFQRTLERGSRDDTVPKLLQKVKK